ncbi:hypothetical protein CPB86DRAFT_230034 [Serendipita vermifera]|nr:hypothetical protein CPB86DRAFT_230034 [Serendipita vermifera]
MEVQQRRGAELEDVRATLVDCGDMLRAANELDVIQDGTEYTKQVASARSVQLESIRADLRALTKSLESSKAAGQRPQEVPTREQHARQIESLEQKQYAAVKAIRKYQTDLDELAGQVSKIKDETAVWEVKDPVNEHEVDNLPLRAQILKSLGFELRRGKDGNSDKVLIRTQSGDLRLCPVNDSLTTAETNELWNINSS